MQLASTAAGDQQLTEVSTRNESMCATRVDRFRTASDNLGDLLHFRRIYRFECVCLCYLPEYLDPRRLFNHTIEDQPMPPRILHIRSPKLLKLIATCRTMYKLISA